MEPRGDEITFSVYEQNTAGLPPSVPAEEIMSTIDSLLNRASGCDAEVTERRTSPLPAHRQNVGELIVRAACMRETARGLEKHLLG